MKEEVTVSTAFTSKKRVTGLDSSVNRCEPSKAEEMVLRLKEQVQVLQEEIIKTRYALGQRDELLRDCAPQKIELRNHF